MASVPCSLCNLWFTEGRGISRHINSSHGWERLPGLGAWPLPQEPDVGDGMDGFEPHHHAAAYRELSPIFEDLGDAIDGDGGLEDAGEDAGRRPDTAGIEDDLRAYLHQAELVDLPPANPDAMCTFLPIIVCAHCGTPMCLTASFF